LALDEKRLGQLADDLGRITQDTMYLLKRQNWNYKMQDDPLIDFARLIVNFYKILYDSAPRPSISKISANYGLSGATLEPNISSDDGFKLFKMLHTMGCVRFDGDQIRIVGGAVPYYVKQGLLQGLLNSCSDLLSNIDPAHLQALNSMDLMMDSTIWRLSESGEIGIKAIPSSVVARVNQNPNVVTLTLIQAQGNTDRFDQAQDNTDRFDIEIDDLKGLEAGAVITSKDLIGHMLRIKAIKIYSNIVHLHLDTQCILLNDPLLSKLVEVKQTLRDSNHSDENLQSCKDALLGLPGLTEDNKRVINSIENPFILDFDGF
jgi:hypothetical protein